MARFDNLELDPPEEHGEQDSARLSQRGEPHDERYWLGLANENRRQGHYENGLRFYSRALELDKSLITAWLGQVQMLVFLEEYPEAELWARKALELFRNHGDLLAGRAQALARLGDVSAALALCDAALKHDGQSAYRWIVRGELLLAKREDLDRHCFDKAVLADKDWLVPLEIAGIYLHYRVPSKALMRLRQAAELAPDNAFVWYRKGLCERALDLDDAARKSLKRSIELFPNYADAHRTLAELDNQGWSLRRALGRLLGRG
jgi:tetratricopeptide (TPR) repeat protein